MCVEETRIGVRVPLKCVWLVTYRSFEGQKRDAIKGAYKDLLRAWKQGAAVALRARGYSPMCKLQPHWLEAAT